MSLEVNNTIAVFVILLLGVLLYPLSVRCEVDTLKIYDTQSYYVSYRDADVRATIARFDLARPVRLKTLILALGGDAGGKSVRIRIFGNEGGLPGPLFHNDRVSPIEIGKRRSGIERIAVNIPGEPILTGDQFFVAVEPLDEGVYLLSDRVAKAPACTSTTEQFEYQIFELRDGRMLYGRYGFVIDALVEAVKPVPTVNFKDVSAELGIIDTVSSMGSIAAEDFDRDGYIDLLIGGRLFRNEGGEAFRDVTSQVGLSGSPRANAFIDIDNDGDLDILFMGSAVGGAGGARLFENDGTGHVVGRDLGLSGIEYPASFSIADADGDGYLDIAVGERIADSSGVALHLLLNDNRGGFVERAEALVDSSTAGATVSTVHLTDLDGDGLVDLFVGNPIGPASLWLNGGKGTFERATAPPEGPFLPAYVVGSDWAYLGGNDQPEVVVSRNVNSTAYRELRDSAVGTYSIRLDPEVEALRHPTGTIDLLHGQAGIATADVDNDGLVDLLRTTSSKCRSATLFLGNRAGGFTDVTFDYGLSRTNAGEDAVWFDYNNDGKLDLATFVDGRVALFKNVGQYSGGHYVDVVAQSPTGEPAIGSRVVLYYEGTSARQEVSSGRGLLMQSPGRLHYGLGSVSKIDSAVVYWNADTTWAERFANIPADTITTFIRGHGERTVRSERTVIRAHPNPFSSSLTIDYSVETSGRVIVDLFTVVGGHVARLVDEEQAAGAHSVIWNPDDGEGSEVAPGVYIIRLRCGSAESITRATLRR